jgi:hypothetical protein
MRWAENILPRGEMTISYIWKDDNKMGHENKAVELILDQFG